MKIHVHIRGKSDSDFHFDKTYLDNIHFNLKYLKGSPTQAKEATRDIHSSLNSKINKLLRRIPL